jgi:CSLREA domain-containing protein
MPAAADAAVIPVTTQADNLDDANGCTLREAIQSARGPVPSLLDGCVDGEGSGTDEIVLPASPNRYELTLAGDGEDSGASGDLDVFGDTLIRGAGRTATVIDANEIDRVFHTLSGTIELKDLSITGGHAPDGSPGSPGINNPGIDQPSMGSVGIPGEEGGGIYNQTALTLTRVRVFDNEAGAGGAGGVGQTAGDGGPGLPGANSIGGVGGDGGEGGGIFSQVGGGLTITESKIDSNSAGAGGKGGNGGQGGIGGSGTSGLAGGDSTGGQGGLGGSGGGVDSIGGALNISSSEISDNHAGASGAGGNGGPAGTGGVGTAGAGGTGGNSTGGGSKQGGGGGGIRANGASFSLIETTIRANTAGTGGAGGNGGTGGTGGTGSTTQGAGGDSLGGDGGDGGWGGGITTNTSTINNNPMNAVAIVQNSAGAGGAGGSQGTAGTGSAPGFAGGNDGGAGGAAGGATINDALTSMTDSTVGENRSGDGGAGGNTGGYAGFHGGDAGIQVGDGITNLTHVTIAGNTFGTGSLVSTTGGVAERFGGDATLYNTLVAGNDGEECSPGLTDGTPGFNLSFPADSFCATFVHGDPKLGPVQDNTGTTPTMALLAGSAAINAADAGSCTGTDQRGVARPKGAGCDIGAFERSPPSAASGAASQRAPRSARVAGTGNMGTLPGSHRFQFGQTTAYGRSTAPVPEARGTGVISSTRVLTNLKPNTLYHYRYVVTNADGIAVGADRTFKTPQVPFAGVTIPADQKPKINDNRVAKVKVRCPAVAVTRCAGTLVLRKKMRLKPGGPSKVRVLGTKQFTIPRGQLVAVKVKVKQAFVDLIAARKTRQLGVNARATATDARGGTPKVTKRPVTLRVP